MRCATGLPRSSSSGWCATPRSTAIADRLQVTYKKPEGPANGRGQKDPWNYWVFAINGGGDVNGEESSSGRAIRGSFSANRTTETWRMSLGAGANYRDSEFLLEDEDGSAKRFSACRATSRRTASW